MQSHQPITEALYGRDHPSKRKTPAAPRSPRPHTHRVILSVPARTRARLARRFPAARTLQKIA